MTDKVTLIKVGGAELQAGPVLDHLADVLARLATERPLVIVHGGGKDIAHLQQRLGLTPRFVEGLRVTDDDSLWAAEMALSGTVNKRFTARLVGAGVQALGVSGVDVGLLRAAKLRHDSVDLGRVGEVTEVNVECLRTLLGVGLTPVVSPISLGSDGRPFNVNADHVALAIATALQVEEAIFLTDVPGVLQEGELLPALDAAEAQVLIEGGVISGGMIPKVRSALEAVAQGVGAVRITNLDGLAAGSGTRVTA
jgi:acetylglutamate kinase